MGFMYKKSPEQEKIAPVSRRDENLLPTKS